jgi:hypothetical protein
MQSMAHLSVALAVVGGAFVANSRAAAPATVEAELRKLDAGWESAVAAKDLMVRDDGTDSPAVGNGAPTVERVFQKRRGTEQRAKLLRHRGPGAIRCQTAEPAAFAAGENE